MVFTSPMVLWALGLLAIPIAIHLFQFRRYKKIFFSDVSLLKEVKTTSQTKSQLKHWIILFTRMMFVALLVLAFADPTIPATDELEESNRVSIYVDNSFSMQASSGSGNLLQHATQAAFEIASSFPKGTRFQLITNSFRSREKRFIDQQEFVEMLDEVSVSPEHRSLDQVLQFQHQTILEQPGPTKTFLLSDFNHMLSKGELPEDTNQSISIMRFSTGSPQNVSIDSVWIHTPITQVDAEQELEVKITNHGTTPIENFQLRISLDDRQFAQSVITLPAKTSLDTSFTFIPERAGNLKGEVVIEDYPVTFDNTYYFTVYVSELIDVVEIRGSEVRGRSSFEQLFDSPSFQFTAFDENELRKEALDKAQVVILNEPTDLSSGLSSLLLDRLSKGVSVLIVPPTSLSTSLKDAMESAFGITLQGWDTHRLSVNQVNQAHFLFNDVFESSIENANLPSVAGHYPTRSAGESVLSLFNGDPLLWNKQVGSGELFLVTSPLREPWSDFHRNALFVPAMINMAAHSGLGRPLAYKVDDAMVAADIRTEEAIMKNTTDSGQFIPGLSLNGILLSPGEVNPGQWELIAGDTVITSYSFNYSREESLIDPPNEEEILSYFEDQGMNVRIFETENQELTMEVAEANVGSKLWPIFVLLALTMIVLETILLKLFSS